MIINSKIRFLMSVTCFIFLISACAEQDQKVLEAPIREVKTLTVSSVSSVTKRSYSGLLKSSNETSYSFKVSGTVSKVAVEVGDSVKTNQLLAALDKNDFELEVDRQNASLAEASALLRNSESEYERTKKHYEAGNSSRSDLDNARASFDSAKASQKSAQKSLEIAKLDLSYSDLKSRGNCLIASVTSNRGENVAAGTEVLSATCGDDLEVELDIPESVIGRLSRNQDAKVSFPSLPGREFDGLVTEVGVSATQGGTTFPVTVLITSHDKSDLKSGLSADVSFEIDESGGTLDEKIVVPAFSVAEDPNGRFVYVIATSADTIKTVKRVSVEVGAVLPEGLEISSGIEPGMQIVTAGVSVLRDGMKVKVSEQ